jgi:magnesium-transporting ATPase (P-type)
VEKLEEKRRQEEDAKRKREEALRLQTEEKRRYIEFCFFFFLQDYILHFIQCACPSVMLISNFCINVLVYLGNLFGFLFFAIFVNQLSLILFT